MPQVRSDADAGNPIVISAPDSEPAMALTNVAKQIIAAICEMGVAQMQADEQESQSAPMPELTNV